MDKKGVAIKIATPFLLSLKLITYYLYQYAATLINEF